jgi:hypothetical protein
VRLSAPKPIGSVIPPSVIAATVALGLFSIWYVWIACTLRLPTIASGDPLRLISLRELVLFTTIDAFLIAGLALDALRSRNAPPGLRLAQRIGLALSGLVVTLFQVWVILAYGPVRFGG